MKSFLWVFLGLVVSLAETTSAVTFKYRDGTDPLPVRHEFFKGQLSPDFWNLISYYVPQQDPSSCGIASLTMTVNALSSGIRKSSSDRVLSQKVLIEKTGIDYKRGLTLDQLKAAAEKAFALTALKVEFKLIHADGSREQKVQIRKLLEQNEKTPDTIILANFDQKEFTGDPEGGGHISPVGAYDSKKNRVLILDVDREYYEPYWIDFDRFIQGMNTRDSVSGKNRGLILIEKTKS